MNQPLPQHEISQPIAPRRTLSGIVAVVTMWLSIACFTVFTVMTILLNRWEAKLGQQSLVVLLLGVILLTGTLSALTGLLAGIIKITGDKSAIGLIVLTLIVNSAMCSLVFVFLTIAAMQ